VLVHGGDEVDCVCEGRLVIVVRRLEVLLAVVVVVVVVVDVEAVGEIEEGLRFLSDNIGSVPLDGCCPRSHAPATVPAAAARTRTCVVEVVAGRISYGNESINGDIRRAGGRADDGGGGG